MVSLPSNAQNPRAHQRTQIAQWRAFLLKRARKCKETYQKARSKKPRFQPEIKCQNHRVTDQSRRPPRKTPDPKPQPASDPTTTKLLLFTESPPKPTPFAIKLHETRARLRILAFFCLIVQETPIICTQMRESAKKCKKVQKVAKNRRAPSPHHGLSEKKQFLKSRRIPSRPRNERPQTLSKKKEPPTAKIEASPGRKPS